MVEVWKRSLALSLGGEKTFLYNLSSQPTSGAKAEAQINSSEGSSQENRKGAALGHMEEPEQATRANTVLTRLSRNRNGLSGQDVTVYSLDVDRSAT